MINIQNALNVASKFIGNDKIKKALELSKTVNSPQSAIKALSKLGDPDQIIDNGLNKLNSPMAQRMASMFGANMDELDKLKSEILGLKKETPITQKHEKTNYSSRIQNLLNGLK